MFFVLLFAVGAYSTYTALAPAIIGHTGWNQAVQKPKLAEDRLYIPKLKLNLAYATGNQSVLNDKLWHRHPEHGNPAQGGNFVLAGHRFKIGFTPGETLRQSPLYHIDYLQPGDLLYVDYHGLRYKYAVTKRYSVKPDELAIEDRSTTPKLTLYTCTLKGSADGREVVDAKLVAKNVSSNESF